MPRIFSILAIALTLYVPHISHASSNTQPRTFLASITCFISSIFGDGCEETVPVTEQPQTTQPTTQTTETTNTYIPPYNPPAQEQTQPEPQTIIKYITETLTPPPSVSVSGSGASYVYVDEQIALLKQELLERINNTTTRSSSNSSSGVSREALRKSIDSALDDTATDKDIDTLREEIMETIAALPAPEAGTDSPWTIADDDIYFYGGRVGIGDTGPGFAFSTNSLLEIVGGKLFLTNGGDGIYLDDGINNTNEGGLFFFAGDEKIATYNYGEQIYNYANGDLVVKGGNVGVGTTTPEFPLTVSGDAYVTGEFRVGNGITGDAGANIAFSSENIGDIFLSPSGGSSIILDGELQSNYSAQFVGGATFLNNGLAIFDDGGYVGVDIGNQAQAGYVNVRDIAGEISIAFNGENGRIGIGTPYPASAIDLGLADSNIITIRSDHTDSGAVGVISFFDAGDTQQEGFRVGLYDQEYQIWGTRVNMPLVFGTGDTERMQIDGDGNVGIGTTNPETLLHVNGVARAGNFEGTDFKLYNGSSYISAFTYDPAGNGTIVFGDNDEIGNDVAIKTNGSNILTVSASGNVGVGTTTPAAALSVVGSVEGESILSVFDPLSLTGFEYTQNEIRSTGTHELVINGIGLSKIGSVYSIGDSLESGQTLAVLDLDLERYEYGGTNAITVNTNNGYVGIGLSTLEAIDQKLDVSGNARFRSVSSGTYAFDLNLTSNGTLTTSASDARLKDNIESLNASSTLNKILQLQPSSFTWKADGTADIGLIAQDVAEVFPELTFTNPTDGYMGVNYSRLSTLLISAVQEIVKKIEGFAERFETKQLCIGSTCIEETELQQLLELRNELSGEEESTASPNTTPTAEPETQTGDTNTDTDPASDPEETVSQPETEPTAPVTEPEPVSEPAPEPAPEQASEPAPETAPTE